MPDHEFIVWDDHITREHKRPDGTSTGFIVHKWSDGFMIVQTFDGKEIHYSPGEYAVVI